jgi:hypothetical protein
MLVPNELAISVECACNISLECWRLGRLMELDTDSGGASGVVRHAARCIQESLNAMGIEIMDFTGRSYDPGLVPEVVEVHQDDTLPPGHAVIEETVAPTLTLHGQVVRSGQIIVKRSSLVL